MITIDFQNQLCDSANEIKEGLVEGYCIILPRNVYEYVITIDFQLSSRIIIQGSYTSNLDKIPVVGSTGYFQHLVGGEAEMLNLIVFHLLRYTFYSFLLK